MEQESRMQAFENVKNQFGYCGIWCGSCVVGNGTLRELTQKYGEMLNAYGVLEWGVKDINRDAFFNALQAIESIPICDGCLKGGGRDHCELRSCALSRELTQCHDCSTPECEHSTVLEHMRSGAHAAGLFVRTAHANNHELLDQWIMELKKGMPSCILFAE